MKDSFFLSVPAVMVVLSLTLASCIHWPTKPTVPAVAEAAKQKAFSDVSYYRNKAEDRVKMAKSRFNGYEKKEEALDAIQKAYADAAARGNAFIETVQLHLTANALNEAILDPYVKQIQTSFEKLDATIDEETKNWKREHNEKKTGSKSLVSAFTIGGDVVEGVVVGLAKAGVVIWQAAQTAKKEEIEAIKNELEKRRWKGWSQIKEQE